MSARADILATLRRSLGVNGHELPRRQIVDDRLARHPRGIVPARGDVDGEDLVALFTRGAEAALATVARVASGADVPAAIAAFLRDRNLPASLRMGSDPRLAAMPWGETTLELSAGPSEGHDLSAVSHAFGGVGETGTLVLLSGPENPTTLNFLPDTHVVVLDAADLAGDLETVFDRLRAARGEADMPRTVNLVTGPSRSADIEQTLLIGAHGPRRLHIVLVGAA